MRYPVTITPDDGQFTVTFPDVPEAVTFGDTREEALQRAPDALLTIFDALIAAKHDIPAPSERSGNAIELPALECTKIELYRAMRAAHVGKAELARRLDWHLPQVDRVLDVHHGSKIDQLEAALSAVGKKLVVTIVDSDSLEPRWTRNGTLAKKVTSVARAKAFRSTRRPRSGKSAAVPGAIVRAALRGSSPATASKSAGATPARRISRKRAAKKR